MRGPARSVTPAFRCAMQALDLLSERPFTGDFGPSGPECAKKISKRVFLGVRKKKSPKIPENRKCQKIPRKSNFAFFLRFFRVFSLIFLQTPKKTFFETFLRFRAGPPGGPETLVNSGPQKTPETENPGIHIERCPKRILRGAVVDVQEGARQWIITSRKKVYWDLSQAQPERKWKGTCEGT